MVSSTVVVDNVNPTTPTSLSFSNISTTSLYLIYPTTTSSDSNFPGTDIYKTYYSSSTPVSTSDTEHDTTDFNSSTFAGNTTTTVSSLIPNTPYYFNIWAYDSYSHSVSSTESSTTTLASIPNTPTTVVSSSTQIDLTWTANNNPGTTVYEVYNVTGSSSFATTTDVTDSITGLTPNTSYIFKTRAENIGSSGTYSDYSSNSTAVYTLGNIPTSTSLTADSSTKITFTWNSNSNSTSTVYEIYDGSSIVATTTATTTALTGLTSNTQYSYQVRSKNGNNATTTYTTAETVYTLAAVPSAPTLTVVDSESITVSWVDNGSTSYYVENVTASTNSGWTASLTYQFTGLDSGTEYTFKIKAKNVDGVETSYSSTVSAETKSNGGSAPTPISSGTGNSSHNISMNGTLNVGDISNQSINILGYINSKANFNINNNNHSLKISNLNMVTGVITLSLQSTLKTITLKPGQEKLVEIDGDVVLISYNNLVKNMVDITVTDSSIVGGISEESPVVNQDDKEVKKTCDNTYEFKSYLTIGHSGDEVRKLQELLESLGHFTYAKGPTGYFGNVTKQAIVSFQKEKNLTPFPGFVGPGTRKALNESCSVKEVIKPTTSIKPKTSVKYTFKSYLYIGSQGEEVRQLQQILEDLGYFTHKYGPTGYFGPVTKKALSDFQQAYDKKPYNEKFNLKPYPGRVGPNTLGLLQELNK